MGDHVDDAIDDLLFGRGVWDDDDGGHYADTLSYRRPPGPRITRQPYIPNSKALYIQQYGRAERFESRQHADDYFAEENSRSSSSWLCPNYTGKRRSRIACLVPSTSMFLTVV